MYSKEREDQAVEMICGAIRCLIPGEQGITVMETLTALERIRHALTEALLKNTMGEKHDGA